MVIAAFALAAAACTADDVQTDMVTAELPEITVDTRAIGTGAYDINLTINGKTGLYVLDGGTLKPKAGNSDALYIPTDAVVAEVYAAGTVEYALDDSEPDNKILMPVSYAGRATPVGRGGMTPAIELTLTPATALIKVTVTDSENKAITMTTMSNVYMAKLDIDGYAWKPGVLPYEFEPFQWQGGAIYPPNDALQILPCTIAAGSTLFTVYFADPDDIVAIYAMKDYTFLPGREYAFEITINK